MKWHDKNPLAECCFHRASFGTNITCESLTMVFNTEKERKYYSSVFCSDIKGCTLCSNYQSILESYGGDEMKRKATDEMLKDIKEQREKGIRWQDVAEKYPDFKPRTIQFYYYGWDAMRQKYYKEKRDKKKHKQQIQTNIVTFLSGNWRFFEDEGRRPGEVKIEKYSPEELAKKFGNVLAEADKKHIVGKVIYTDYAEHFKQRAV